MKIFQDINSNCILLKKKRNYIQTLKTKIYYDVVLFSLKYYF